MQILDPFPWIGLVCLAIVMGGWFAGDLSDGAPRWRYRPDPARTRRLGRVAAGHRQAQLALQVPLQRKHQVDGQHVFERPGHTGCLRLGCVGRIEPGRHGLGFIADHRGEKRVELDRDETGEGVQVAWTVKVEPGRAPSSAAPRETAS